MSSNPQPGTVDYMRAQLEASQRAKQQADQNKAEQAINYQAYQEAKKQAEQKATQTGQSQTITTQDIQAQRQNILDTNYRHVATIDSGTPQTHPGTVVYEVPVKGVDQEAQAKGYQNYQNATAQTQQRSMQQDAARHDYSSQPVFGSMTQRDIDIRRAEANSPDYQRALGDYNQALRTNQEIRYAAFKGNQEIENANKGQPTAYSLNGADVSALRKGGVQDPDHLQSRIDQALSITGMASPKQEKQAENAIKISDAGAVREVEKPTGNPLLDFGKGFAAPFENLVYGIGDRITGQHHEMKADIEGDLMATGIKGASDYFNGKESTAGKDVEQIGKNISENPAYAAGNLVASGLMWLGPGEASKAIRASGEVGKAVEAVGLKATSLKGTGQKVGDIYKSIQDASEAKKFAASLPKELEPLGDISKVSKITIEETKMVKPSMLDRISAGLKGEKAPEVKIETMVKPTKAALVEFGTEESRNPIASAVVKPSGVLGKGKEFTLIYREPGSVGYRGLTEGGKETATIRETQQLEGVVSKTTDKNQGLLPLDKRTSPEIPAINYLLSKAPQTNKGVTAFISTQEQTGRFALKSSDIGIKNSGEIVQKAPQYQLPKDVALAEGYQAFKPKTLYSSDVIKTSSAIADEGLSKIGRITEIGSKVPTVPRGAVDFVTETVSGKELGKFVKTDRGQDFFRGIDATDRLGKPGGAAKEAISPTDRAGLNALKSEKQAGKIKTEIMFDKATEPLAAGKSPINNSNKLVDNLAKEMAANDAATSKFNKALLTSGTGTGRATVESSGLPSTVYPPGTKSAARDLVNAFQKGGSNVDLGTDNMSKSLQNIMNMPAQKPASIGRVGTDLFPDITTKLKNVPDFGLKEKDVVIPGFNFGRVPGETTKVDILNIPTTKPREDTVTIPKIEPTLKIPSIPDIPNPTIPRNPEPFLNVPKFAGDIFGNKKPTDDIMGLKKGLTKWAIYDPFTDTYK